jgi:hypothetical protein
MTTEPIKSSITDMGTPLSFLGAHT